MSFVAQLQKSGFVLGSSTVAFFDLDQTVYAAKGRDDEPLRLARWEAIRAFLADTLGEESFDETRARAVYREFDQDAYHAITRDNMDYVVLLVLAVASGLSDSGEVREFGRSAHNDIGTLTAELYHRASRPRSHDKNRRLVDLIRAIHYNTLAGDQTPCKDFRTYECVHTAARMGGDATLQPAGRICLNREVVDLIDFLQSRGCLTMAISDRPPEAASAVHLGVEVDLMKIAMPLIGEPVSDSLRSVTIARGR